MSSLVETARSPPPSTRASLVAAALLLGACGGGESPEPPAAPFALRIGAASIAAPQDSRGTLRVGIERQPGFSAPIEIDLSGPPAGVGADAVVVQGEDEALLPMRFGPEVATGPLVVVVQGTAGSTVATVTLGIEVEAPQPRSQQLIQAALEAGEIDLGTALLYRAYAAFGDAQLPERLVGSGPDEEDLSLMADIEQELPTSSPEVAAALQPYRVRPDDPASAFNLGQPPPAAQPTALTDSARCAGGSREWITQRSSAYPVRAWALCLGTPGRDETAQNDLFKILDVVDKAYGQMAALMGPAREDQYGDEAIDVYVVPPAANVPRSGGDYAIEGVRGVTHPQPPFEGRTCSGHVMLPTWRLAQVDYELTVIHELFHVLQFAHNCRLSPYWFTEASASWASVHFNRTVPVSPADNKPLHRERFGNFQHSSDGLLSVAGDHEYYAYIWPLFMEQQGGEARIGYAWSHFEDVTSESAATAELDAVLGFKDNFRRFAVRNVDQELLPGNPVTPRYQALDPTFPQAELPPSYEDYALAGEGSFSYPLDAGALAARYVRLLVGESSSVQSVDLDWSSVSGRDHLDVDALIDNGQTWISPPVALESDPRPRFCFDLGPANATRRGSFRELRLVFSNHAIEAGQVVSGPVRMKASENGCAGWSGEIRWSQQSSIAGISSTASTVATVTFEPDTTAPSSAPGVVNYRISTGVVSYHAEVTTEACHEISTADVTMSSDATNGEGATFASLSTFSTGDTPQYGANTGATIGTIVVSGNCTPDGSDETVSHPNQMIPWWNLPGTYDLKADATLMQEDVTTTTAEGGQRNSWTLHKIAP
jgi:hypothetical protein